MSLTPIYFTDTYITINGLKIFAHHGVCEQERKVGNDFIVDAVINYDARRALDSDAIEHAVNYADVIKVIKATMAQPCNLIEHVAGEIAQALLTNFQAISSGTITVSKVKPPIDAQLDGVSFTLAYSRS